MKLRVLAGAKTGTEIPLKKSKFIIGRASDCTLRAGSDAISRHHCVLLRDGSTVSVRDLGSRNGTYVNGEKIAKETQLSSGDTFSVGPLKFVFETAADIDREKKPKVKDVAEAVARTAENGAKQRVDSVHEEDDISRWLLDNDPADSATRETQAMHETQTFRMDETHAVGVPNKGDLVGDSADESETVMAEDLAEQPDQEPEGSGKGKKGKPKPGKLPFRPSKPKAENSGQAAADILREMARRR